MESYDNGGKAMTAVLVKSMSVQLKVGGGGESPWYEVLAIASPFWSGGRESAAPGGATEGHFLIKDPEREPKLRWVTPHQIADVTYQLY
jgi:hypothetical protein